MTATTRTAGDIVRHAKLLHDSFVDSARIVGSQESVTIAEGIKLVNMIADLARLVAEQTCTCGDCNMRRVLAENPS